MENVSPNQNEEAPATPQDGGENYQKEFDSLFAELDLDEEKSIEELKADVEAFKEESKNNFAKFYSEKGMEIAKKKKTVVEKPPESTPSDLEVIFFEGNPEAELVKDDLEKIAKAKGISLVQAWKSESWLAKKAAALHAEKIETEENKWKVGNPSAMYASTKDSETKAIEKRFIDNLPKGFSAKAPRI